MICKTELIVLKTSRFQENHQIITAYTAEFGMKSFLVKSVYSRSFKKTRFVIQPMSILEVVYFDKYGKDLQVLTEFNYSTVFNSLWENPYKLSTSMLFVDIFNQFFKNSECKEPIIYQTLYQFLILTDSNSNIFHVFFYHLLKINNLAGYKPVIPTKTLKNVCFDLENASFHETDKQVNPSDLLIYTFLTQDLFQLYDIPISNLLKRNTLELLFRYFTLKIDNFEIPKSFFIFKEILI